jgi:hypothetical protein
MRVVFCFFVLVTLLTSCSLNADQERSLSEATTNFMEARKKGAILAIVSMYHPEIVRTYKERGDSIFVAKFTFVPQDYYLSDPVIEQIQKKGKTIHVQYSVKSVEVEWGKAKKSLDPFFAISDDAGKSWFFIDYADYVNESIVKDLDRLISVKK